MVLDYFKYLTLVYYIFLYFERLYEKTVVKFNRTVPIQREVEFDDGFIFGAGLWDGPQKSKICKTEYAII